MLSLIPSIHATILSIVVAVVVVVLPIAYQNILKSKSSVIEKCKAINEIFYIGFNGGGEFEDIYENASDNDFYEGFRSRIKNIIYNLERNRSSLEFIIDFNREFTLLNNYASRFLSRSPFLGSDENFEDFLKSDIHRASNMAHFFHEMSWMIKQNNQYIISNINRYYDIELPKLDHIALEIAKGNLPWTISVDEQLTRQMGVNIGKRHNKVDESTAGLIKDSLIKISYHKHDLIASLNQLTDRFDYALNEVMPELIEEKKKYNNLQSFFKSLPDTKIIYTFIYSTLTFGIVAPLIINEIYSRFSLEKELLFWIISLGFALTFIPYYFALRKVFLEISKLKT